MAENAGEIGRRIAHVQGRLYRLPLDEVVSDAMHGDHTHFELITVTVRTADGAEGTGYTYTGGRGGRAVLAMIEADLAPFLTGRDAGDVEALHDAMQAHLHYVGRGGIAGFAISAADIALWDLRGRREGLPLWRMAGGAGRRARSYAGGIDLNFPLEKLVASVEGYLARGLEAVKIKVGQAVLAEDVARVAAVRAVLGPDRAFMVDANYGQSIDGAIAMARAFRPFDLLWFEEPTDPDDLEGYARIAVEGGVPLAMGENLHILPEFARALKVAGLRYIQPDASNCGGITGWLRVAALAARAGVPACSHGMQELHVSLVAGAGSDGWVEVHSFPIDRYCKAELVIDGGRLVAPDRPGTGVVFDRVLLAEADDPWPD